MLTLTLKSIDKISHNLYLNYLNNFITCFSNQVKFKFFTFPVKKKKFAVLKSPHVHKKSFEHFEFKKYKTIVLISNFNKNSIDFKYFRLLLLNKPKNLKFNLKINL